MFNKKINEKFISDFISASLRHMDPTGNSDSTIVNKAYDELVILNKQLQKNNELTNEVLPELLKSVDFRISTRAAAFCLSLNKYTKEAEKVLEKAVKRTDIGLVSFDAKMTLMVWREQGFIIFK